MRRRQAWRGLHAVLLTGQAARCASLQAWQPSQPASEPWQWFLGAQGVDCDVICGQLHANCSELGMRTMSSPEMVYIMSQFTLMPCNNDYTMTPSQFPSVAPGGQCTYLLTDLADWMNGGLTCNQTPFSPVYRYCPCAASGPVPPPTTAPSTAPPPPATTAPTTPPPPTVAPTTAAPPPPTTTTLHDPDAHGDPHLTNIHGERFDVMQEGYHTLLRFPGDTRHGSVSTEFRVVAAITKSGAHNRCNAFYIVRLWLTGTRVGEAIEVETRGWDLSEASALRIKVGNRTMDNSAQLAAAGGVTAKHDMALEDDRDGMQAAYPHLRVKFAHLKLRVDGIQVLIQFATGGKRPNSLDIRAGHLIALGSDWGGLLGDANHSWVSAGKQNCSNKATKNGAASGTHREHLVGGALGEDWFAAATLE